MKLKFLNLFIALSVFCASVIVVPKSANAATGLLFRSQTLKSFGAITAKRSGRFGLRTVGVAAVGVTGAILFKSEGIFYISAFFGIINGYASLLGMGLGLIILDDHTVTGIDYLAISEKNPLSRNYTQEEIATYNSELEELNAIKDTLAEELQEIKDYQSYGAKLWENYSEVLSPATVKIAEDQAYDFVKNLK